MAGIAGSTRYASTSLIILSAKRVEGSFKVPRPKVSTFTDQDDDGSGVYPTVDKIKAKSTVIQVDAKRLIHKIKSLKKNDMLDMLLPRMLR
ncbi:hypothetical protein Tco_0113387 [Tanacetum coccineum]